MSGKEVLRKLAMGLISAPERLVNLCCEQYDKWEIEHKTRLDEEKRRKSIEAVAIERSRINEAMKSEIKEERERYKEADKELTKYRKLSIDKTKKIEELSANNVLTQMKYDNAIDQITELKDKVGELEVSLDQANSERDRALYEAECCEQNVSDLQDRNTLHCKARFDSTSEKTSSLFQGVVIEEDPLDENVDESEEVHHSYDEVIRKLGKRLKDTKITGYEDINDENINKRGHRKKGKLEEDISKLNIHVDDYSYSESQLDQQYGKGQYAVIGHNCKTTFEITRPIVYVKKDYSPKLELKDENGRKIGIKTVPDKNNFHRRNSKASPSIAATMFYDKFMNGVTTYRQEKAYESMGVPLSRQTMTNWTLYFGETVFMPLRIQMLEYLKKCNVIQCDETTWKIVMWPEDVDKKGRVYKKKNGSNGYIWVYTTGEYYDGHKIAVYFFDKSRSTEQLRKNLKSGLRGLVHIVSDAYSAYKTLSNECTGIIIQCGCWMHARRNFAEAVDVLKPWLNKKMTDSEILAKPEVKGLLLINDIFHAESPLRQISSKERHERRQSEVKPLVNKFFKFAHSVNLDDKSLSKKLRDAIQYVLNNEQPLREFLTDGNVPMDNGFVERKIRHISLIRKNSLFSYSIKGAKINGAIVTAIETAKMNGADVYLYLKYVLTYMPQKPKGWDIEEKGYSYIDPAILDDLMPWSEKYKQYEKHQKENGLCWKIPLSNKAPEKIQRRSKAI